jgi:hypothetical protein
LVHLGATPALFLTGVVTHTAQDTGKRHRFTDEIEGFLKATLGDEGHVALDADATWAGRFTRRDPSLFDGKDVGHSAITVTKDGLARLAIDGNRHWADRLAISTGSTLGQVHVARAMLYLNLEIAPLTGQASDPSVSQNLDARMFNCLQHLSGQQIGGKLALVPMAEKR